jgi:hypothetical protein
MVALPSGLTKPPDGIVCRFSAYQRFGDQHTSRRPSHQREDLARTCAPINRDDHDSRPFCSEVSGVKVGAVGKRYRCCLTSRKVQTNKGGCDVRGGTVVFDPRHCLVFVAEKGEAGRLVGRITGNSLRKRQVIPPPGSVKGPYYAFIPNIQPHDRHPASVLDSAASG